MYRFPRSTINSFARFNDNSNESLFEWFRSARDTRGNNNSTYFQADSQHFYFSIVQFMGALVILTVIKSSFPLIYEHKNVVTIQNVRYIPQFGQRQKKKKAATSTLLPFGNESNMMSLIYQKYFGSMHIMHGI